VTRISDALVWLGVTAMARDLDATVEDDDLVLADEDVDAVLHQAMRHAVANRVDVDEAVGRDAAAHAPLANRQHRRRQRTQRRALVALEARVGSLVRRAVDSLVGGGDPAREVRFDRGEARERQTRDRISLHVADARLGLTFGARAIWATRGDVDAPVFAERGERRMHARRAGLTVFTDDERAGAIDQDLARDPAEAAKRASESLAPIVLALTQRRAHVDPTRVTEHRDEQVHFRACAGDLDPLLAEVDLHRMPGRGLEPHRRELGGALVLAMRREHAL
jgi:hypothetical protein